MGDIRMVQEGQGLAFGLDAGDDRLGIHARLDDLQGDLAFDGVFLLGQVDDAHTPFAEHANELVATDPGAGSFRRVSQGRRRADVLVRLRFVQAGKQQPLQMLGACPKCKVLCHTTQYRQSSARLRAFGKKLHDFRQFLLQEIIRDDGITDVLL